MNKKKIILYFDRNSYVFNLIRSGNGPVIILLHGWNHSSLIWLKIIKMLNKKFELIAIDLPGFGESPPLPNSLITLDYYSVLIQQIIKKILENKKPFLIIGDSLGAIIVLKILSNNGNFVDRVVLSGCPIDGLPKSISFLKYGNLISCFLKVIQKLPLGISHNIIKLLSLSTFKQISKIDNSIIKSVLLANPDTSEILFKCLYQPYINEDKILKNIPIKSVIIRGEFDKIVRRETALKLARILNGTFVEIKNVGHTPMIENPEFYIKTFTNILYNK